MRWLLSHIRLFATRQEYWNGLPFPFPGDLPDPRIEPKSPALLADSLRLSNQGTRTYLTSKEGRDMKFPDPKYSFFVINTKIWCINDTLLNNSTACLKRFSVQFSHSVVYDSLRPHELQHTRPPCPSLTPEVHSDSRPSSR